MIPAPRNSIVSHVIYRVVLVVLIYAVAAAVVLFFESNEDKLDLRRMSFLQEAKDIEARMGKSEDAVMMNMTDSERFFYISARSFYQFAVRNKEGDILFHSPDVYMAQFPDGWPQTDNPAPFTFKSPQGVKFSGISVRFRFDGQPYLVQVAQSKNAADDFSLMLVRGFMGKLSLYGLPFLIFLIGVIMRGIRRSLSPLSRAAEKMRSLSLSSPGIRMAEERMPDEIRPLVHAINQALNRLEAGIGAQREFTANAAHELRTPLSILRMHVDTLQDQTAAAKLRDDVDAMARLVTQLLDAARLDFPDELTMADKLNLADVVRDVCAALWPLVVKQGRTLDVMGIEETVFIHGNYDSLYRALRNLIDNALHHTPRGTAIEVTLAGRSIRVRDHGPGIADADREKLFNKFWRKSRGQGGAGLGLSIVSRTMELHGGRVHVEDAPDGGAVFVLEFQQK